MRWRRSSKYHIRLFLAKDTGSLDQYTYRALSTYYEEHIEHAKTGRCSDEVRQGLQLSTDMSIALTMRDIELVDDWKALVPTCRVMPASTLAMLALSSKAWTSDDAKNYLGIQVSEKGTCHATAR